MSADTHPRKELSAVCSPLNTLPLSLSICHFSSSFVLPPPSDSGAENWRQFAVRLMQSYGHRNKSHTCPPPPYTSANTLSLLLTASFFVILNSWLAQDTASCFSCSPQEPIRNTAAVHTTALVPLLTRSRSGFR